MRDVDSLRNTDVVLQAYSKAWEERYGRKPFTGEDDSRLIKPVIGQLGAVDAVKAVKHYVGMDNNFYLLKGHDLQTFSRNVNAVLVSMNGPQAGKRKHPDNVRILTQVLCDVCPPGRQNYTVFVGTVKELYDRPTQTCHTCVSEGIKPLTELSREVVKPVPIVEPVVNPQAVVVKPPTKDTLEMALQQAIDSKLSALAHSRKEAQLKLLKGLSQRAVATPRPAAKRPPQAIPGAPEPPPDWLENQPPPPGLPNNPEDDEPPLVDGIPCPW